MFGASFIMCGMLFCEYCNAMAPDQTGAEPCTDLHYYQVAELAHDAGWIALDANVRVACPRCAQDRVRPGIWSPAVGPLSRTEVRDVPLFLKALEEVVRMGPTHRIRAADRLLRRAWWRSPSARRRALQAAKAVVEHATKLAEAVVARREPEERVIETMRRAYPELPGDWPARLVRFGCFINK